MTSHHSTMCVPMPETLQTWLQGGPEDLTGNDLFLLLLIQPNCPGCHVHAIPVANQVSESMVENLSVYCVSTAFEDFEYNHEESARDLVHHGKLVGVAAQQLGNKAPHVPTMPVAHDVIVERDQADPGLVARALATTKQNARDMLSGRVPDAILQAELDKLDETKVLPEKIATIFWTVQGKGTPTWVLHDKSGKVLDTKFGQVSQSEILDWSKEIQEQQNDSTNEEAKEEE